MTDEEYETVYIPRMCKIMQSAIYVVLATPTIFDNPDCVEEMALAAELGKPLWVIKHVDTVLPDGFLESFPEWRVTEYTMDAERDFLLFQLKQGTTVFTAEGEQKKEKETGFIPAPGMEDKIDR